MLPVTIFYPELTLSHFEGIHTSISMYLLFCCYEGNFAEVGMVIKATLYYLDKHANRPYEHEAAAALASVRKGSNLAQHWVRILAVI